MGKFILLGAAIALADIVLLVLIYQHAGVEALLATIFLPPIIGGRLTDWCRNRVLSHPVDLAAGLGDQVLLTAAKFMFGYPGPITTLFGLLLLIPAVRRLLQAWAVRRMMKAVTGGTMTAGPGMGGFVFSSMSGSMEDMEGFAPHAPSGPLKRAEGTVIDAAPELQRPPEDDAESGEKPGP